MENPSVAECGSVPHLSLSYPDRESGAIILTYGSESRRQLITDLAGSGFYLDICVPDEKIFFCQTDTLVPSK